MNQRIISATTLAVMVVSAVAPSFAMATEGSVHANVSAKLFNSIRANVKAEIKDLRSAIRIDRKENENKGRTASKSQEFQEKKDAKELKITDVRKKRIKSWWTRVAKRLSNIIDQERKFATQVEKRLNKLAEKGANVTQARNDLAAARVKIDVAASSLASASTQVDVILSSNTPKDAFTKLHALQKNVIAKIRDAHKALVKVVVEIKTVATPSPTPSPTASPTPSPTATP
jgi:flagellar motility protein MotE (MotC chaperone)